MFKSAILAAVALATTTGAIKINSQDGESMASSVIELSQTSDYVATNELRPEDEETEE